MKHLSKILVLFLILCSLISCFSVQDFIATDVPSEVPPVEEKQETVVDDTEYARSVAGLAGEISFEKFQEDKAEILRIIAELDVVMKNSDYQAWVTYLTPSSISYWSNKLNLQLLSRRLPNNQTVLTDLSQYFRNLFIPSRQGKTITEIRYNSPTDVKAVQVDGNTDVIYYNFIKIDDKWLVSLPKL